MARYLLREWQRNPHSYYLFLNLPPERYQSFKRDLIARGLQVEDRRGEPYPSREPGYNLFCYIAKSGGSRSQVEAHIAAVLGIPRPVHTQRVAPPAPAISLTDWERRLDQVVRELGRSAPANEQTLPDQLTVTELIRSGHYLEAERVLDVQRRAGIALDKLAKQYLWVYSEEEKWAELAETFEATRGHLSGSLRSYRRAARAYLELARGEPSPSTRHDRFLGLARECLEYALQLEEAARDPEEMVRLLQIAAETEELAANLEPALAYRLRAQALLERHDLEGSRENRAECSRQIQDLMVSRPGQGLARELQTWLEELPDQGETILEAAGVNRGALRAEDSPGPRVVPGAGAEGANIAPSDQEWAVRLAELREQAAEYPAEVVARITALLESEDEIPGPVVLTLRLVRLRAQVALLGYTSDVCAEFATLWNDGSTVADLPQRRDIVGGLLRCAMRRGDSEAILELGEQWLQSLRVSGEAEAGTGQSRPDPAAASPADVMAAGSDPLALDSTGGEGVGLVISNRDGVSQAGVAPGGSISPGEVLAVMGLAAEKAGQPNRALIYLKRALEQGWSGKEMHSALARIYRAQGQTDRAKEALLQVLAEDAADTGSLRALLDLYMNDQDWENSLQVCRQFLDQLRTPQAAYQHREFYEYRKMFLEELIDQGRDDLLSDYSEAIADLVDLHMEAGNPAEALTLFNQAFPRIKGSPYLADLISNLEAGDAACRRAAAELYTNLALQEIDQVPRHDHELLRDLLQRVYPMDPAQYRSLRELFAQKQQEVNTDPLLRPEGGVIGLEDPAVDLSGRRVAVVGAYADVRRRVEQELRQANGLAELIDVPPSWERNLSQDEIKSLIQGADLVVEVSRCVKHKTTVAVQNLLRTLPIPLVYARGKGQSSIIAAVREYFQGQPSA